MEVRSVFISASCPELEADSISSRRMASKRAPITTSSHSTPPIHSQRTQDSNGTALTRLNTPLSLKSHLGMLRTRASWGFAADYFAGGVASTLSGLQSVTR